MSLHKMKLKYKLYLLILAVSITISFFMIGSFRYILAQYNELLYHQTANSLTFLSDELEYQIREIENVSSDIAFHDNFQKNLEVYNSCEYESLDAQKARTSITKLLNRNFTSPLSQITVVPEDNPTFWWGEAELNESEEYMNEIFKACDDNPGNIKWFYSKTSPQLLCARKILKTENLSLEALGYLVLEVDLEKVMTPILSSKYTDGNSFQIYLHTKQDFIYSSGSQLCRECDFLLSDFKESYLIDEIGKQQMFIVQTKLDIGSDIWYLSLAVAYDEIFQLLNRMPVIFMISLLLALMIAFLLAGYIVKNITKQFHILIEKMEFIKKDGVMSTSITTTNSDSHDEMAILNSYFDQMVVELKKLIEESYVKQLLITQAELKALEQQINPHFLYNTLNTVNWLAKKGGQEEIATIAKSLGNLLRCTLKNSETTIPLQTEMEIVFYYLNIQKIRFEDLAVTTYVESGIEKVAIPKMTVQPLVENAIFYSQEEPQTEYCIRINLHRKGEKVRIEVANSGLPIDEHILEHLRDESVKANGNGIGLLNINSRLRIILGEDSQLHFENKDGMAIVWFEIPYEKKDLRKETGGIVHV